MIEGLGSTPVFLAGIRRQFQGDHRDGQAKTGRKASGLVLQQLRSAGLPYYENSGIEAPHRFARGFDDQVGRIAPEVTSLKRGVGNRGSTIRTLDHGKQQIGVGVALRGVQKVVHTLHGRDDAHRAYMRRPFIGPERQFHAPSGNLRRSRRTKGRVKSSARSPA